MAITFVPEAGINFTATTGSAELKQEAAGALMTAEPLSKPIATGVDMNQADWLRDVAGAHWSAQTSDLPKSRSF